MHAVVTAAGQGTRMGPLTDACPKPLLPVAGAPILEHILDTATPYVDGFVLVVGYEAAKVRDAIGNAHHGLPVEYVHQSEQLGTAHAIQQAEAKVDGAFLAINGDVLLTDELVASLASSEKMAMAVKPVEDPHSYGVVDIEDGRVTSIVEKPADPPSNLANLGSYRFTPQIFEYIANVDQSKRGEYEITDAIEQAIHEETIQAVEYDGPWLDIGRPWELLEANSFLLGDLEGALRGRVEPDATIKGPVVVEDGARVRNGAYIEGPVIVESGADVGPNAYVRGASVVGPDVRVGNAVEIKNSILLADTAVGHLSYVGDSVLGRNVNLGAGTTVANLRHDDQPVHVQVKGEMVDTGRRKFGVIIGDRSKTAIDTSLNAGVTLGTETLTAPDETLTRDRNRE